MACFNAIIINISAILLLSQWSSTIAQSNTKETKTCPSPSWLITKACKETASISSLEHECIISLTSNQQTASASSALELAKETLSVAMEKANVTMILIGSPKKPCFKSCAENYKDGVVKGLEKAWLWIEKGEVVDDIDDELSLARDAADYCNMILSVDSDDTKSPIFAANKDVYNHITFVMSVVDLL